jgi:hypothetical protein
MRTKYNLNKKASIWRLSYVQIFIVSLTLIKIKRIGTIAC